MLKNIKKHLHSIPKTHNFAALKFTYGGLMPPEV